MFCHERGFTILLHKEVIHNWRRLRGYKARRKNLPAIDVFLIIIREQK